ncbi:MULTISPECIES: DUF3105 domain-containing protein [Nocardia]|uniref:DUF3105 domain-containing protein n=1 Tax=Nocardia TaxID=1817 RepID=UPI0018963074|nr:MULTISPECIES: DUF3105 domain-containing protein [Nocardia]MBF6349186.1 DUF3105 domain-containing protein [Nocardia flavorosea]
MPNRTSAKSAKAVKAAGKASSAKGGGGKNRNKPPLMQRIPWLTVGAVVVLVALVGALAVSLVPKYQEQAALRERQEEVRQLRESLGQQFAPTEQNQDPSTQIQGVVTQEYPAGLHVDATQRVAYDKTPPFGGPHDASWADCMGTVYDKAIREENAVHSLEHGAIWITYNPEKVDEDGIDTLKAWVDGEQYMLMSPHPDQEAPISLQSWGHQLSVPNADDERIGQFVTALRLNNYAYPEVGASCTNPTFGTENPPAYDPSEPGADAVPMDGGGIQPDQSEMSGAPGGLPGGLPGGIPAVPGMPGTLPQQQQAPAGAQPAPGAGQ